MELSPSTSQSITIRTLSFSDKNEVMRISKGIYFGHDYIPLLFDEWMADPNRTWFGIFVNEELAGMEIVSVYDFGRTVMFQALRVDEKFRGLKLSSKLVNHLLAFVKNDLPSVVELRSTTTGGNKTSMSLLVDKQGYSIGSYHPFQSFNTSRSTPKWEALEEAMSEEQSKWVKTTYHLKFHHQATNAAAAAGNNDTNAAAGELATKFAKRITEKVSGSQLANLIEQHPGLANLVPRSVLLTDWFNFDLSKRNLSLLEEKLNHVFLVTFEETSVGSTNTEKEREGHEMKEKSVPIAFSLAMISPRVAGNEWWTTLYCSPSDTQALTDHYYYQLQLCYEKNCASYNIVIPDCRLLVQQCDKLVKLAGMTLGGEGLLENESIVTMWKEIQR